jgi:hypothetical protein
MAERLCRAEVLSGMVEGEGFEPSIPRLNGSVFDALHRLLIAC